MPTASAPDLIAALEARTLVHDTTDRSELAARLAAGPVTLYCGFDPTAASLHVGNLQQILLLRRFQEAGHRPLALAGGATGMIGDPGGKSVERPLLDLDELDANRAAISAQLERFLDFSGGAAGAKLVDNRTWTQPMGILEFLRDVGKHFTVNRMLGKDSVRSRIEREDGISFTEFSYMLLQANDYLVLNQTEGCELQVAGSDQWGNITAGIDLIRRSAGQTVHGLTSPLLMRSDGQKFGKSEGGALWLDAELTSPYQLFQYFMQVDDADVEMMLLRLTFVPLDEIAQLMGQHQAAPERRDGQRALARALTAIVHGPEVLGPVEAATALLFGADPQAADERTFDLLAAELPTTDVTPAALDDVPALFVAAGLAGSKGEIRRNPRGYYVNGHSVEDQRTLESGDLLHGRYVLLRRGKAAHHLVRISG